MLLSSCCCVSEGRERPCDSSKEREEGEEDGETEDNVRLEDRGWVVHEKMASEM